MGTNREVAERILNGVGGSKNIESVVHCVTRLRFILKDENKADTQRLQSDQEIIQIVQSGGQYQVVLGSHVADVYQELLALADINEGSAKKGNIINRFVDIISAIFTPFLGAMAGAGVLKGFLTLALTLGWISEHSGVYLVLFSVADGIFTYLPIPLAFTAAQKFRTNPYLAIALAMGLVHPLVTQFSGDTLSFFGLPVIIGPSGYTSSIIPVILAVFLQSYVERFAKKIIPAFLSTILVPLFILLIMAPITFIIIGPIGTVLGDLLGQLYYTVYNFSPTIAGAAVGGLWQVLVMFGMHWGFIPIMFLNMAQGSDTLMSIVLPAILAQGGAALAVFFLTKSRRLKGLAFSSVITSIFGITEPTVYGVNLPLKRPFVIACISGAIGGAFISFNRVHSFSVGLVSLLSLPSFISPNSGSISGMVMAIIGTTIAFILAFILTLIFRFKTSLQSSTETEELSAETSFDTKTKTEYFSLASPLEGEVMALTEVSDQVFASEALGKGVAIKPTLGKLYAPVDGKVTTLFSTGHALGMTSTEGVEVLMHIGLNTINLEGDGFTVAVQKEDFVRKGDLLITFDMEKIKEAGLTTLTPIIVTNTQDYLDVLDMNQSEIVVGEDLLTIVPGG
ncbi:beta-glucoside-specific PTS transporter subunit IIABC [Tetragenococcus muriaticus]|uniref:PTS system sucrose-specific EIIBCA component n=2 Tax=Tetragenococcus muriaticus TaxID=64642 RepID=A0A091CEP5_9ENTE|nr:beta-glucoside-specific PTS transporter subunit IIABC [Tetragenococcus muriaticus]KFN93133.1 PTS system beta-glucoside-specific IIBCA component [Tetragenococcus muriaticus 3MR10-3]